jgi:CHAD domain-containing protein
MLLAVSSIRGFLVTTALQRRGGRLSADFARGLRAGLAEAFRDIVAHATRVAAGAKRSPERAVHEWRKAIRRARSILQLARPLLGEDAHRALSRALASAARQTSSLRDSHVLAETLERVPPAPETKAARRRIRASLEAALEAATLPGHAEESLRVASATLAGLPETFAAGLVGRVGWDDLEASLRRSHRRMRVAWKQARKHRTDQEVHAWRKRVKELRYALEMLTASRARYVAKQHAATVRLAEGLGEVTDLMLLHDWVRARQAELPAHEADALLDQLRRFIRKRLARVLRRARPLVARRPKRFAAKTVAAVRPKGAADPRAEARRAKGPGPGRAA